eukprot:gene7539-5318_t
MELNDLVQLLMDRRENVLCSQSPQSGADDAAVETMLRHILARISDPHLRTIVNWSQCGGDPVAAGNSGTGVLYLLSLAAKHGHLSAFVGVLLHQRQVPFFVSKFSISGNSDTEPRNIRITHKAQWDDVKRLRLEDYIRFQFDEGVEGGKIMLLDNRNSRRRSGIMYDDGTTIADFEKLLKGGLVWLVCMRFLGTLPVVGRLEWLQEREGLVWVCPVGVGFRRTRQVYYCEEDDDCVYRLTVAEYGGRLPVSTGCRVGEGRFSAVMIPYGIPDVERRSGEKQNKPKKEKDGGVGAKRNTGWMPRDRRNAVLYCGTADGATPAVLHTRPQSWMGLEWSGLLFLLALHFSLSLSPPFFAWLLLMSLAKVRTGSYNCTCTECVVAYSKLVLFALHFAFAVRSPYIFVSLSALRLLGRCRGHGWAMLMFDGASEDPPSLPKGARAPLGQTLLAQTALFPLTGLGSVWRGGYGPARLRGWCLPCSLLRAKRIENQVCGMSMGEDPCVTYCVAKDTHIGWCRDDPPFTPQDSWKESIHCRSWLDALSLPAHMMTLVALCYASQEPQPWRLYGLSWSQTNYQTPLVWEQFFLILFSRSPGGDLLSLAAKHGHLSAFVGVLLHQRQVPFFVSKFSISGISDIPIPSDCVSVCVAPPALLHQQSHSTVQHSSKDTQTSTYTDACRQSLQPTAYSLQPNPVPRHPPRVSLRTDAAIFFFFFVLFCFSPLRFL